MREGWIKLHRKIIENGIADKPEYGWLWIHLLIKANHKDHKFIFNNKEMICKRGQLITGRKELAKSTGINESKVERILKYLKIEQQIEQQTYNKFRLITILNYDQYQEIEQENEQQVNNKRTTNEHNKECNNNKNDKKEIYTSILKKFNQLCDTNLQLTESKKRQLNARLKTFSEEQIIEAIEKRTKLPWYMGENADKKQWFKDWDSLFRNDEKIERILETNIKEKTEDEFYQEEFERLGDINFCFKYGDVLANKYLRKNNA